MTNSDLDTERKVNVFYYRTVNKGTPKETMELYAYDTHMSRENLGVIVGEKK